MNITAEATTNPQEFVPTQISPETLAREQHLRNLFREMESVLVAYSGGVDSSYVAFIANDELVSEPSV